MSPLHDRHADLLRSLGKPALPATLSSREFIDSIYERALERSASRLDAPLRKGLRAVDAPRDVAWCEPESSAALARELSQLPRSPAPGLLWPRIRSDLRRVLRHRRWMQRARFAAIAAALLLSALLLFQKQLIFQKQSRSPARELRIREVFAEGPFQSPYSQRSIVRKIARRH